MLSDDGTRSVDHLLMVLFPAGRSLHIGTNLRATVIVGIVHEEGCRFAAAQRGYRLLKV